MTGLSNNKEFLRMSIFFLWLINISGFFGMLSDQNEFFLSTTPYVLSLTLLLLILNHDLSNKKSKIGLMLIFLFGLFFLHSVFLRASFSAHWQLARGKIHPCCWSKCLKIAHVLLKEHSDPWPLEARDR